MYQLPIRAARWHTGASMFKSLYRIDRSTFWLWAIPILFVHGLVAVAIAYNVKTSLGPVDTGLIVVLAMALAGRFRDIGWPVWIGPTFLLGTALVMPLALLFYMISIGTAGSAYLPAMTGIGLFSSLGNIVLLVVARCVPGLSTPPGQPSDDDPNDGLDAEQPPTAFEEPQHGGASPLLFAAGAIGALLLVGAAVVGFSSAVKGPNAAVEATTAPTADPYGKNGLTKETNDFLRSPAKSSPNSVK
jgi:hypothetical protein